MANKLLAANNAFSEDGEMNTTAADCYSECFYFYILLYGDGNQYKNNCHYFYESTKDTHY